MSQMVTAVLLAGDMERLFDLDFQLLHDAVLTAIAVFVLFFMMSYLLFNPAREMLKKRQERIQSDLDSAKQDKEEAAALKQEYDEKIKNVQRDAEEILSSARKKAVVNEEQIVAKAKEEANRIVHQAQNEAELEKQKAADDVKAQIIDVATALAGKVVSANIDTNVQDSLVEETLREVGENTWQN